MDAGAREPEGKLCEIHPTVPMPAKNVPKDLYVGDEPAAD
jgi:hypothetical protein